MRKYYSFFRVRFQSGLQYRMAALAAVTTQFVWGLMECLAYKALLESDAIAFPMEYEALVSYIWLKEAFLVMFATWATDNDIFGLIMEGGIAYELCRPISLYKMWFARSTGSRLSTTVLKCVPILLCSLLLPKTYRMAPPASMEAFLWFLLALTLGVGVTIAFCMLVYILCFFTVSPQGWRMLLTGAVEFLSGSIIPLPFIPQPFRGIVELLPFAAMQNVPFRIYGGDLSGVAMRNGIILQALWLVIMVMAGRLLCRVAERRLVIQGG